MLHKVPPVPDFGKSIEQESVSGVRVLQTVPRPADAIALIIAGHFDHLSRHGLGNLGNESFDVHGLFERRDTERHGQRDHAIDSTM